MNSMIGKAIIPFRSPTSFASRGVLRAACRFICAIGGVPSRRTGRLLLAASVVSALAVSAVDVGPAFATLRMPGGNFNGSGNSDATPLRGVVSITETAPGGGNHDFCGGAYTDITVTNSAGQQVFSASNGGGALSVQWTTETVPNGSYTVTGNWTSSGIEGFRGCTLSGVSTDRVAVQVDNIASLSYSGPTSAPWGTSVSVSARLVDPSIGQPLPGEEITFSLSGEQPVSAETDASGVATATIQVSPPTRSATMAVYFAGTPYYEPASTSFPFSITGHPTRLIYTGPTSAVWGSQTALSAKLVDEVTGAPVEGDPVDFTIGSQEVVGSTNSQGIATAVFVPAETPNEATCGGGPTSEARCIKYDVTASFPGDADYQASSASPVPFTIDWQYSFVDSNGAGTVYLNPGSSQFLLVGAAAGGSSQVVGPLDDSSMEVLSLPTGEHVIDVTFPSAELVMQGDFVEETGQFLAIAATPSRDYVLSSTGAAKP